ncbi:MAG TPA: hypothetical protein VEL72_06880 [Ktedonobacteraceae bacterium]|nr:hypothetical protein [Ktedonobacteraceae bacterium]
MIRIDWLLLIIGTVMGTVLLSSCGSNSTPGTNEPTPLPTATEGPVTLRVGATLSHTSDTFEVILSNRDDQTIYFADHQTNCSVILLQQEVNGNWVDVDNCGLGSLSAWHTLDSGKQLTVKLAPRTGDRWPTGLYRAQLRYRPSNNFSSLITIYSAGFEAL